MKTVLRLAVFAVLVLTASAAPAAGPFKIGLLLPVGAMPDWAAPFVETLASLGYVQGRNLSLVVRIAKASNAELPALASELVADAPDVLVASSTPPSLALKEATATIPIVAINIGDPVGSHLVASLAHPGGNVTAVANSAEQWIAKRMEQVGEVFPGIRCVMTLRDAQNPSIMMMGPATERLGRSFGFELRAVDVSTAEDLERALAAAPAEDCRTALLLPLDVLFVAKRSDIVEYALKNRIALFAPFKEDAEAGALIAFGVDAQAQWRAGATHVDRILKGEKPADLPVERPVKWDIVVNLKAAKAIGAAIPPEILSSATEVIE